MQKRARLPRLKVFGKIRAKSFSQPHRVARLHWLLSLRELRFYYLKFKQYSFFIRELLQKSFCPRLFWETTIGFADCAATGIATGVAWSWKGVVLGYLSRFLKMAPNGIRIRVIPDFGKPRFEIKLDCILETRLGHIIIGLFRFFLQRKKFGRKAGSRKEVE